MNAASRNALFRTSLRAGVGAAAALLMVSAGAAPRAMPEGFIGGTVKSSKGPEAGVWVIAQTD